MLSAFLSQYYLAGRDREIPKSVIASSPMDDRDLLAGALSDRAGHRIEVACNVRGRRARWARMAADNAELSLNAMAADRKQLLSRFVELQAALGLEDVPRRLECFDISHAGGEATVASCVVFDTEGPLKSDYRRFQCRRRAERRRLRCHRTGDPPPLYAPRPGRGRAAGRARDRRRCRPGESCYRCSRGVAGRRHPRARYRQGTNPQARAGRLSSRRVAFR